MSTLTQSIIDGVRSGRLGGLTRAQQVEAMEAWEVLHSCESDLADFIEGEVQPLPPPAGVDTEGLLSLAERMVEHLKWARGE